MVSPVGQGSPEGVRQEIGESVLYWGEEGGGVVLKVINYSNGISSFLK